MSEQKIYRITKNIPSDLLLAISPLSNREITKTIYLTRKMPTANIPLDWILGIFLDDGLYSMYKKGYFSFDNDAEIIAAAKEANVFFDEDDLKLVINKKPEEKDFSKAILTTLKAGFRPKIEELFDKYDKEMVVSVASMNANQLPYAVIQMIEQKYGIQLIADNN